MSQKTKTDALLQSLIVKLSMADLAQPFSLRYDGHTASLGDLIDEKCSAEVRATFGRNSQAPTAPYVRPIIDLTPQEFECVVVALLQLGDPSERMASGHGSFSSQDMIREIKNGTAAGRQLVAAVRQHSSFLETAAADGRVQLRGPDDKLELPDFEF